MDREPWICPECGRTLRVRNQEHTCARQSLDAHFEGKDPVGAVAFDWICEIFDSLGPYDIVPMKTTIGFSNGVNIAFLTTTRRRAEISVVLARPLESLRIVGSTPYSRRKSIYRIAVSGEGELDAELEAWLREAYQSA